MPILQGMRRAARDPSSASRAHFVGWGSESYPMTKRAPDVHDVLALDLQAGVRPMRSAEDQDLAGGHDFFDWQKPIVNHVWVRAAHGRSRPCEKLADLVRE